MNQLDLASLGNIVGFLTYIFIPRGRVKFNFYQPLCTLTSDNSCIIDNRGVIPASSYNTVSIHLFPTKSLLETMNLSEKLTFSRAVIYSISSTLINILILFGGYNSNLQKTISRQGNRKSGLSVYPQSTKPRSISFDVIASTIFLIESELLLYFCKKMGLFFICGDLFAMTGLLIIL